ncbi:MAG: TetR/AcrR family transcriptional regulator [Myxococcales bacterium]|nr:TetR/AcrR family transcriptional regulator [Myxococcales bacterium]
MARPADLNAKVDLLRAAEQVFVEHGLEHARVEQITARAGRSKGSFYLHFESKEEAFRQIVESMTARMACFLDAMSPDKEAVEPFPAQLENWHCREVELFEFLWQNRGLVRLLMRGGGSVQFGFLVDSFAERARAQTVRWLETGIARGLYRKDLDIEVASLCISGAYDRIARRLVEMDKKPDIAAWLRSVQRVILLGLVHDEARPHVDGQVPDQSVTGIRARKSLRLAEPTTSVPVPASVPENPGVPRAKAHR